MLKKVLWTICVIATILASAILINIGWNRSERSECLGWQEEAKRYPAIYYLLGWQKEQCDRWGIEIKTQVR